jgi:hypothetical protein
VLFGLWVQRRGNAGGERKATNRGLVNLSVLIDEDRPTIFRFLNSNHNKLDLLLDRLIDSKQVADAK